MSGLHSQDTASYMLGMFDRIQLKIFCTSTLPTHQLETTQVIYV